MPNIPVTRLPMLGAALAGILLITACDGPNEKAGEAQDRAAANAAGVADEGGGPAERIGEARDNAERAARKAADAQADAVKAQAGEIKADADVQADRMEQEADRLRAEAKRRADAMTPAR